MYLHCLPLLNLLLPLLVHSLSLSQANVQRLLASEPRISPSSSPMRMSTLTPHASLNPHPSPHSHSSLNPHPSPHSHTSLNPHPSPHSHTSLNPHPSPHSHTSLNPHPSPHSHTSLNPHPSHEQHTSENPHHFTSADHHSTSSAPSNSCSATPPTISDGSYSSCTDLQMDPGIGGHCQATVLTHPLYGWYV